MQTFLPYQSYERTAKCLDMRRLGKQRVEGLQILRTLLGISDGWSNHPAVRMWKGYEFSLVRYTLSICREWKIRGYRDTITETVSDLFHTAMCGKLIRIDDPSWTKSRKFHLAHRSNLLRKDPVWYGQFGWKVPNDLPYVWPVK